MRLKISIITLFVIFLAAFCINIEAQSNQQRTARSKGANNVACPLTGVYRIDLASSDKLYSVVEGATSKVPFGQQQRFFMDLSIRLTPPDILAIECSGNRVSIGSSRASRVTFVADGITHNKRNAEGNFVRSRISLQNDELTFTSSGKAEDNVNVTFTSVDNGTGLQVTRSIYSEQLTESIIIKTVYDKIDNVVRWDNYSEGQIDKQVARQGDSRSPVNTPRERPSNDADNNEAGQLRNALNQWIDATNKQNIEKQMSFYMQELKAFYLARDTSSNTVRIEKTRAFANAKSIDIRAEEPEIIFQDGGQTAIMRFRKKYRIENGSKNRSGEVIQELRWRRTNNGWRIFSERDIKVLR
jgi:ketosteroid isomerase-like protein